MQLQGIELEVDRKGAGQPLLLLHGGGGPIANMPFAEKLAEKFEIFAPHTPGFLGAKFPTILPGLMIWSFFILTY